jgi:hypothetical protein
MTRRQLYSLAVAFVTTLTFGTAQSQAAGLPKVRINPHHQTVQNQPPGTGMVDQGV